MKKLFTFLFLLLACPAYAQYYLRTDCGSLTAPSEGEVCSQTTTASGRTAGHLYIYRSAAWVDVDTAGTGAPTDATFITQTADGDLSNEQAMGLLATGIVKNTTTTGVQSIATAGTDYVAPTGSGAGLTALNATQLTSGTVPTARMGSGTADNTVYLRGDSTWSAITTVAALSANGVNCSTGNAPLGVDAAGAVEGCFDVATQTELNTHTALTGTGAHSAASTNTANAIVARDASGNFAAGTITAALTGNVTGNLTGNAATATTATTAIQTAYPEVVFASLPAIGTAGRFYWVTDCESTIACSVGGGTERILHYDDGVSWIPMFQGSGTPTLDAVMTVGNATSMCIESDPCQFGNGTVYVNVYCTDENDCIIEGSQAGTNRTRIQTDQVWQLWDIESASAVVTADPDAGGTGIGTITFGANQRIVGGIPTLHVFRPAQNEPPAANFATLDTRNSRPVLDFDATTEESAVFSGVMNRAYAALAVIVDIHYAMTSAIAADTPNSEVIWCAQFERVGDGQLDIDSDSFHTAICSAATTVPATSGHVDVVSLTFTNQAAIDGIVAGEGFRLKIYRDADAGGDDAAGDAELVWIEVRQ